MTRSSRLLAVGVAVIVLGLVVAFLALRDTKDEIVVNEPGAAVDGALDTEQELDGATATQGVGLLAEDAVRLPLPVIIPEGHEAVAVTVTYASGTAALPVPGDRVNIYAVFTQGLPAGFGGAAASADDAAGAGNGVVRMLSAVEVLGVTGVEALAGGGNVNFVVAVTPGDAERLIFQAATQQLWFTLVNEADPVVDGVGVTLDTVLDDAA